MQASIHPVINDNQENAHSRSIRNYTWILAAAWMIVLACSFWWSYLQHDNEVIEFSRAVARAAVERDFLYRRWASMQGGLYVPPSEKYPPNPYLSHLPDREAVTSSGRRLTLLNPAYMIRQVYDLAKENEILGRGHLTGLKPIRPENAPDDWERQSLLAFDNNLKEISEIQEMDGRRFMRLMRPFIADQSCLKCHAFQGYREGDVVGGLSVSIPLAGLEKGAHRGLVASAAGHGMMLVLGWSMIGLGGRQLSRSANALKQAEEDIHQTNLILKEEIAERQLAQEAQHETELRLRIVADYASDWEYWRMPDYSFAYMSPSAVDLTGYKAEEFLADRNLLFNIIHPDDRESFECHTDHVDADGRILPIEMRIVRKDGELRWIGHTCRQVYAQDGSPWGWRASNQDITARKLIENELERLNRVLEQRVENSVAELRQKDQILIQQGRLAAMGEMINNIAHQWRQPLNNIALIIQNLQLSFESGTITGDEMDREIDRAMSVIMHMSRTIDDFRNFFREDKEKKLFSVNQTVRNAIEFVSASLRSRGIIIEIEETHEAEANGYPGEYAQVLLNLIANASDACAERCVNNPRIAIRIAADKGRSVVSVRDNCGGIPDAIMPKIFDPYFTTRSPDKGSGIGLYMSKVIIEINMSGSLTAVNVDGGAEFRIEV